MSYGRMGYSDDFRKAREREQAEQERLLKEQKAENERVRAEYLAGLAGQRAEQAKRAEQELDRQLEPRKAAMRRDFLKAHPHLEAADFETAWRKNLRDVAVEEHKEEQVAATYQKMRASGRYSF